MPTQVQFRRGNTIQNNSFTGASGEITINTETNSIRVHDGNTAGGAEITRSLSNAQLLAAILTVDGAGSNLDADLLDGLSGGGGGSYALKANNLSVFASTTSAQLAGVISDETGSGSLVFATSPTLAGTPQAPTAANNTSNSMVATTQFVQSALGLANLSGSSNTTVSETFSPFLLAGM